MPSIELSKSDIIRLFFSFAVIALLVWLGLHVAKTWFPPPCGERVVSGGGLYDDKVDWQCGPHQYLETIKKPDITGGSLWVVCRCNK